MSGGASHVALSCYCWGWPWPVAEVVSASFFPIKLRFCFIISILWGDTSGPRKCPLSRHFAPHCHSSWQFLPDSDYCSVCQTLWVSIISSTFTHWNSTTRKSFLFSPTCWFVCFCLFGLMASYFLWWIIIPLIYMLFTSAGAPENAYQAAHCNHSQLNMVMSALTASRVWSCSSIHFYALFIPESLSTARATVEGPVWKGQVSETSRTDWRQAGPGFEKRPCSLKCMFRRTRERLTGDGSGSKKLLKGRSLGKHLGPEL